MRQSLNRLPLINFLAKIYVKAVGPKIFFGNPFVQDLAKSFGSVGFLGILMQSSS